MALTDEQVERYARHLILKGVGVKGQKRLLASSVLIIGAGGLGSPAALYLAAAGVGHIGLVDGDVVDITLNTVKVENFDHTITTIPAYALISDSFINWRNMQNTGARRIKRSVNIDIGSIAFCTDEMLADLKNIRFLSEYIAEKKEEIALFNRELGADTGEIANGRRLTNLGLFRVFLMNYLKSL